MEACGAAAYPLGALLVAGCVLQMQGSRIVTASLGPQRRQEGINDMMNMNMGIATMFGMGLVSLLVIIALGLSIAALIKYLTSGAK